MSKSIVTSQQCIKNRIFLIRGLQVMIDRDLAEIYQVETKVINQAVKRNVERFPESFRFQLNKQEARSQIVTLNNSRGKNIKYLPYVFTEQGVAMLSAILRSPTAIAVSIQIMNAFVEMRKIIANHSGLLQRIESIEYKQIETDHKFEQVFKALESNHVIPSQGVFFDGQVFDAYKLVSKIIRSADDQIVLIDNFMDENTLTHLTKRNKAVKVLLLTKNISQQLTLDVKMVNEQYGGFEIKAFTQSHD